MFNRMGTQDRLALQGVMKSKDEAFQNAQQQNEELASKLSML